MRTIEIGDWDVALVFMPEDPAAPDMKARLLVPENYPEEVPHHAQVALVCLELLREENTGIFNALMAQIGQRLQ